MPLSDQTREAAEVLVNRYPVARSALLPLLHLVQSDHGYVTDEGIAFCAEMVGLTKAEVGAVATFYTMFKREPVGDWLISICTNPTCKNAGAQDIYERFRTELGGHHDADAGVTVEHAECLGICDAAPVIQVNYEMYGPCGDEQADQILAGCRAGEPPRSNWSDELPPTFKEVEWELSGAADPFNDHLIRAARQQVGHDVPPAYRTGETDIPVTHAGGDPRGVGGAVFRQEAGIAGPPEAPGETPGASTPSDVAAAQEVAGEGRGVAEERADAAGESPAATVPQSPEQPSEGAVPASAAGDEVTGTDEDQVERRVGEPPGEPHGADPEAQTMAQHDEVPGVDPTGTASGAEVDEIGEPASEADAQRAREASDDAQGDDEDGEEA